MGRNRIGRRFIKQWMWASLKSKPRSSSNYLKLLDQMDQDDREEQINIDGLKKKSGDAELCSVGIAIKRNNNFSASCPCERDEKVIKKKGCKDGLVPKGHLVVYVGQDGGHQCRFVVPVVNINHPLFGQLLKESEEEYGFSQPGVITIPCHVSYFKIVLQRIAGERFSDDWRALLRRKKTAPSCKSPGQNQVHFAF